MAIEGLKIAWHCNKCKMTGTSYLSGNCQIKDTIKNVMDEFILQIKKDHQGFSSSCQFDEDAIIAESAIRAST